MGKFRRVPADVPVSDLSPLNISCGSTKCDDGLHCFTRHQNIAMKKFGKTQVCYECGTELKTWDRLHQKNIKDSKFVFDELKNELIRHVYWHMPIKDSDKTNAINNGVANIETNTIHRLTNVIGIEAPFREGITPYFGDIVFYGQHATACCCRVCIEYWHGIPRGRAFTKEEIDYLTKLIMSYVKERIPELKEDVEKSAFSRT